MDHGFCCFVHCDHDHQEHDQRKGIGKLQLRMFFLRGRMPALSDSLEKRGSEMKLSELKADTSAKVVSLGTDERFVNRITSIGMSEGAAFEVVKNDKKMPVLIYVRETLLAMNKKDCERIEVESDL